MAILLFGMEASLFVEEIRLHVFWGKLSPASLRSWHMHYIFANKYNGYYLFLMMHVDALLRQWLKAQQEAGVIRINLRNTKPCS